MKVFIVIFFQHVSREMERQRYLEWEKQRILDLENHHRKELEYVTGMRDRSKKLNTDYQSLVNNLKHFSRFILSPKSRKFSEFSERQSSRTIPANW